MIGGLFARGGPVDVTRALALAVASRAGAVPRVVASQGSSAFFGGRGISAGTRAGVAWVADLDLTNADDLRTRFGFDSVDDVVPVLYERRGREFVHELRGGFALAIHDQQGDVLLLAVDHFGIRRLFYSATNGRLAFASRASALGAAPGVDMTVDPAAIYRYLNFGFVPAPHSAYRGVRRLPPGHRLVADRTGVRAAPYWNLTFTEDPIPLRAAAEATYRTTEQAVSRCLGRAAMKETGAFLSGGTDSSTVVGLMSKLTGEKVNTFSIGFGEKRYDELEYAAITAGHFAAAAHTHIVTPEEAFEVLPRLVDVYDEPFANDSAIGTYWCARLAADTGITRLLAGDGGDEIFGGNERYRTDAIFGFYGRIPPVIRQRLIEPALTFIGPRNGGVLGRAQRYVRRASTPNPDRFYSYEFFFGQNASDLLDPAFVAAAGSGAPLEDLAAHWRRTRGCGELNRLLYLDLKLTIGDNDLYKVTETSQLAGVRVGFPLLDLDLVTWLAHLPASYKLRGLEKRYLFKRAFRQLLPAATLKKRKHGFGVPVATWLRSDTRFHELAKDMLLGAASRTSRYFLPGAVERLFASHANDGTSYYGSLLWTVLMLELWQRRHAEGRVSS
jgi:asparagine synthase (glutamine-hydrolysing)